jgi:hypothetical protein
MAFGTHTIPYSGQHNPRGKNTVEEAVGAEQFNRGRDDLMSGGLKYPNVEELQSERVQGT